MMIKALLCQQGWELYYTGTCCGGRGKREYYRNEQFKGYEVRLNHRKSTYQILLNNSLVAGPDWLYKLESKMKELKIANEVA